MGRLKTGVARGKGIELNRERRRDSFTLLSFTDNVWHCVASHASRGHALRLKVDDDGRVLECLVCGTPIVMGSDDVIEIVMEEMKACGFQFEVLCGTERGQQ